MTQAFSHTVGQSINCCSLVGRQFGNIYPKLLRQRSVHRAILLPRIIPTNISTCVYKEVHTWMFTAVLFFLMLGGEKDPATLSVYKWGLVKSTSLHLFMEYCTDIKRNGVDQLIFPPTVLENVNKCEKCKYCINLGIFKL